MILQKWNGRTKIGKVGQVDWSLSEQYIESNENQNSSPSEEKLRL